LNQKGLAVGIIMLFIVLSTSPISIGSNVIRVENYESSQKTPYQQYMKDPIQKNKHSENNVIVYFADSLVQYSKTNFRGSPWKSTGIYLQYGILCFNASLKELTLSIAIQMKV